MVRRKENFVFLDYLADEQYANDGNGDAARLPSLNELSAEVGVSISSLREQLEVARTLGFVEVRPRTGIRRLPYTFAPAVYESLSYAIARKEARFDAYADLRQHVEAAYWHEAVALLTDEDKQHLQDLLASADKKLKAQQIQLPHPEHRELHLTIFRHLNNPFVLGILEAYWDAYEDVGLARYEGLAYLEKVWRYHHKLVDCIIKGDLDAGHAALVEHFHFIDERNGIIKS
ncbi:MAG: FadR family transcriptional regulator [Chloroflexi bacterium]|nr:MAG: FadR family transcriptional regulator [Chloroflexota bacterium]MBL1194764.1 FadR family transcriptional regulator [Chloroflexota bacterium]NOH12056.1 FadR family transcriptional regulator [Chloroflexota bacterium]